MSSVLGEIGAAWRFLRAGVRSIDKTASLFPSSRFLVRAMAGQADLAHARCVVEFGPGTGVVTEALLAALPQDAHLHAIELDARLLQTMGERVHDPRLRPVHGSAADAVRLVQEAGCSGRADAIFSSLGLALMHDRLRADILREAALLLRPGGVFVQYTYLTAKLLTYQFGQGWSRFDGARFLRGHFQDVRTTTVWANAPPAAVYACREPLAHAAAEQRRAPAIKARAVRARRRPRATSK